MSREQHVTPVPLVLKGMPDGLCFESWEEALQAITEHIVAEVPGSVTNVTVSRDQPRSADSDQLWFRIDGAGTFIGLYVFSAGKWIQVFPVPGEIHRILGDSREPPAGYVVISDTLPGITAGMLANIQATWVRDASSTYWIIFDVLYVGG